MLYNDQPIRTPRQDILGRAGFAKALARTISTINISESGLVIGLTGEWGAGKSSIVSLVCYYLTQMQIQEESSEKIHNSIIPAKLTLEEVIKYSDHYSQVESQVDRWENDHLGLIRTDYKYIQEKFEKILHNAEHARFAHHYWLLNYYQARRSRVIVVNFSPWLISGHADLATALLLELGRAIGDRFGLDVKKSFAKYLENLTELAPVIGAGIDLTIGGGFASFFSATISPLARRSLKTLAGTTLNEIKTKLERSLKSLDNKRVIIIVDDMDRLTPWEAVGMVSLVKGLGDLPNVAFLICYDEKRLAKLLKKGLKVNGDKYLEKIVQFKRALPILSQDDIERLFTRLLNDAVGSTEFDADQQKRLSSIWYFALRIFLRTPRDVLRLFGHYKVSFAANREFVDPIDLLLLEALHLFEPGLYRFIHQNISDLTGTP